jgi:hypothetical protein
MPPIKQMAEQVRDAREPVAKDNPLLAVEQATSTWLSTWLDGYRIWRDGLAEAMFVNTYGSPLLQAAVGLGPGVTRAPHHVERDLAREAAALQQRHDLETLFEVGGLDEAAWRGLLYVRIPQGSADERGLAMLKALRDMRPSNQRARLADLKKLIATQYLLIRLDEERAVQAIPRLLPERQDDRQRAFDLLCTVLAATGAPSEEEKRRLDRIAVLLGVNQGAVSREAGHA